VTIPEPLLAETLVAPGRGYTRRPRDLLDRGYARLSGSPPTPVVEAAYLLVRHSWNTLAVSSKRPPHRRAEPPKRRW